MPKAKKEKKQKPLEQVLMESCNKLRSNMSGINYMYFVMGLVFLKFASLKFEKRREEIMNSDESFGVDDPVFYGAKNVFYITEKARWSYIKDHAKDSKIGTIIDEALQALEDSNEQLKGALPIGNYAKTSLPPSNFASLISEIDKIHEDEDHPMNDLIGKTYQYMLNAFAIKTADEKGEFYTPENIVDIIITLIEPYEGKVYDPCCGSGGMFIQSYKFVEAHKGNINNISVYGQESNEDTWRLAKMNLGIRGIPANLGEHQADTFGNDLHKTETFDYIIANPPFNLPNWRTEEELKNDPRWAGYGLPPVSNANYAWILHMLSKLSRNGIAGFLLANGALGDTDTVEIRKNLIKNGKIEAIIVLPREMFYYTDISVTLWIMSENKNARRIEKGDKEISLRDRNNEILFMDLRRMGSKDKDGYIELDMDADVKKVKETFDNWRSEDYSTKYKDVPEFCKSVDINTIKNDGKDIEIDEDKSNWSLIPSKYIEFIDHDLDIDFDKEMKRIQKEMAELLKEEKESQEEMIEAFKGIGYELK